MSYKVFQENVLRSVGLLFLIFSFLTSGCAVQAARTEIAKDKNRAEKTAALNESINKIKIQANSPAGSVRVFYKNLREKRFREALFLTNLRPAIEGLTDTELKDLSVDFENLAVQVPADFEINGEIVSGNQATVTAKLPNNETDQIELQEIKLRKENGVWVILTVDEKAEADVKKEGKNYFFNLRVETHQEEARQMLNRIVKAQMVYALQNGGLYGEMADLIEKGFLPDDIKTADSTGYNYKILLSSDKKKYSATAEPVIYGKTGKLSFLLESNGSKNPRLTSRDKSGQPLKEANKM